MTRQPPVETAVVVGSGPNGLAAAITLAQAGVSVRVLEASDEPGGGVRSRVAPDGVRHDTCASVFPFGRTSPFFRSLELERFGLHWSDPEILLAHPLDGGRAVCLYRSLRHTRDGLGADGAIYGRWVGSLASGWDSIARFALGPLPRAPRRPFDVTLFGTLGVLPCTWLARGFAGEEARALLAGVCAHQTLPLNRALTAAYGLILLAAGHVGGWPFAAGGSAKLSEALTRCLGAHGGKVTCSAYVGSIDALEDAGAILFDCAPQAVADIARDALPGAFRNALRAYRPGPAVTKVDYVLDGPIPWTAPECRRAGTVHVGGSMDEIAWAKAEVLAGRAASSPFVIVGQESVADPSRVPDDVHTAWAYTQVPNGWTGDEAATIERQVERFAPGFTRRIRTRTVTTPAGLERENPNLVGGDIAGGALTGLQLFLRPTVSLRPYATPNPRLFICSASTPPGGGVHGMCGYRAAEAVLKPGLQLVAG
jgi:phytoene dehydrogenase-like protein